jgi:hypothetical protein
MRKYRKIEVEVTKFQVWEKTGYKSCEKNNGWMLHETFETIEEANSYINSPDWEYIPECKIIEITEYDYVDDIPESDERVDWMDC